MSVQHANQVNCRQRVERPCSCFVQPICMEKPIHPPYPESWTFVDEVFMERRPPFSVCSSFNISKNDDYDDDNDDDVI